jgi:hypothetical protein
MEMPVLKSSVALLVAASHLPQSPLLSVNGFASSYIECHYLSLIKTYYAPVFSPHCEEVCRCNLDVLLALAVGDSNTGSGVGGKGSSDAAQKFYQLRVVSFLSREINLEYEVTTHIHAPCLRNLFLGLEDAHRQYRTHATLSLTILKLLGVPVRALSTKGQ